MLKWALIGGAVWVAGAVGLVLVCGRGYRKWQEDLTYEEEWQRIVRAESLRGLWSE
jgi:hypothetical protein